jgi:N-formylglutamate amidohydrolase
VTRTPLPFPQILPATGNLPVLLSVPHSGTDYPEWLVRDARRGRESLELLEDPRVDRLAWRAVALGCGAVIARAPRAAVDCNRSLREIDPTTPGLPPGFDPGARARGGLGIVPTRTPKDGEIWRRRVSREETDRRIAEAWRPYHSALTSAVEQLRRRYAEIVLLDCHSMPPRAKSQPQIIIGDRHGKSAGRWLGDLARRTIEAEGFTTTFNDPYAGGWIVDSLGKPEGGVHALQIELDRGLYLDRSARKPGVEFDRVSRMLESLAVALGEALLARHTLPHAAE